MVGALSVVGSPVVDSHTSPCLCLDALPTSNMNLKNSGELVLQRNSMKRRQLNRPGALELGSSFVGSWHDWRLSSKAISGIVSAKSSRKQRKDRRLVVVCELGGQYEDSFGDVKRVKMTSRILLKMQIHTVIQSVFKDCKFFILTQRFLPAATIELFHLQGSKNCS